MKLESKVKALVIDRGYNSLADFAKKTDTSYHLLRRLAYGRARTIDVPFLIDLCKKLDCEIGEILFIKK